MERTKILKHGESKHNPLFLHMAANWQCRVSDKIQFSEPLNVETSIQEFMKATNDKMSDRINEVIPKYIGGS
jgi:hypothetical protein